MNDDDGYGWDDEHVGPTDADIQMAGYVAESNRAHALRQRGVCQHSSAVGLAADGTVYYPEQRDLKPGEVACTEHTAGCSAVFPSNEAWDRARHAAFTGEESSR